MKEDTLVIDVETQKSFAEVGGEHNKRELGVSILGVYSYTKDAFFAYEERELIKFRDLLQNSRHLIGFNLKQFDLPVLEPYLGEDAFGSLAITDLYEDALNFLGFRVGLGAFARATLGEAKSGNGLDALRWFKEGRMEDIKKYCLDDVRLTRDLYEYGKKHGHILFESYFDGKIHSIPVPWGKEIQKPLKEIIEEAFQNRRRLAIEYLSSKDADGLGFRKSRLIDVFRIKGNGEIEAYCHLRRDLRNFRINRILKAEMVGDSYIIPDDFQKTLF